MDADWEDKRRADELIVVACLFTVIATVFVGLRCISRFVLIRNPGPDDYLILGAWLLTWAYVADLFVGRANHMGFPMTMLTLDMTNILKATLAIQVTYYANIFCIKTSIMFTYIRFAVSGTFRTLCIATIVLHTVFFFICFVVTLAQCQPLHKMWDLTGTVGGSCINTTAFFYSTSGFNIITDIWILLLPVKTLASVNRPRKEKIALFFVFGVGAFACVASMVRLHTIYTYTLAADPFKDSILVNLWSIIEVGIAICCASVPALKPVFSRAQRQRTREASHHSRGSAIRRRGKYSSGGSHSWHFRLGSKDLSISLSTNTINTSQSRTQHDPEAQIDSIQMDEPKVPKELKSMTQTTGSSATRVDSREQLSPAETSECSVEPGEVECTETRLSSPPRRDLDRNAAGQNRMWHFDDSSGPVLVLEK